MASAHKAGQPPMNSSRSGREPSVPREIEKRYSGYSRFQLPLVNNGASRHYHGG